MANKALIQHLNRAISLEYAAVIQYNQQSALVMDNDRKVYEDLFNGSSQEAQTHAKKVADWIVSLGGVPTIETATVKQATSLLSTPVISLPPHGMCADASCETATVVNGWPLDIPTAFLQYPYRTLARSMANGPVSTAASLATTRLAALRPSP